MAWDAADEFITLPATTNLSQYTLVSVNSAGKIARPAAGGRIIGVLVSSGTQGGTATNPVGTVQIVGVAKVVAAGGAVKAGGLVYASTLGRASTAAGAGYVVGYCVEGSSGSTGRVVSVSLTR